MSDSNGKQKKLKTGELIHMLGLEYNESGRRLHTIENVLFHLNLCCRGDVKFAGVLPPKDLDSGDYLELADSRTAAEVWPEKSQLGLWVGQSV